MSILRKLLLIVTSGITASLLSSVLHGTVAGLCPNLIGERPCAVVAGGWPVRYIVDVPGISVDGAVNLLSAIGNSEDRFLTDAWLQDVAFWSLVWAVLGWVTAALKSRCAEKPGNAAMRRP